MIRWAAGVSLALGLVLLGGVGVRSAGDLPPEACSQRRWLPAEGSIASSLLADHRAAIGCSGQTPNNARATRATVWAIGAASAIAALAGARFRRRPVVVAAAAVSVTFVVGLVAYVATDSPPLSTGLVVVGALLGSAGSVRRSPA